jgi:hypothetical protein
VPTKLCADNNVSEMAALPLWKNRMHEGLSVDLEVITIAVCKALGRLATGRSAENERRDGEYHCEDAHCCLSVGGTLASLGHYIRARSALTGTEACFCDHHATSCVGQRRGQNKVWGGRTLENYT